MAPMTTPDIANIVLIALIFVLYVPFNDLIVAHVCRPGAGFPWIFAFTGMANAVLIIRQIIENNWLGAISNIIVTSMCARIIWHWWRRRRKGKPFKVLGLVGNLGHRLIVVPVRGESPN
jgi:hypothetical protein